MTGTAQKRRRTACAAIALLFALGPAENPGWTAESAADGDGRMPNVIVMMVDDMGYSDLGSYGGEIKTPNLDRLAAEGVRFTRFYNTSRCCPSRACILTGLYPHQTGLGQFVGEPLGPFDRYPGYQGAMVRPNVTMAEVLAPLGYATGHVGKWHVAPGKPQDRGFGFAAGVAGGYWVYFHERFGPTAYCTDWFGDQMVKFIEASARDVKPFFAYWAPNAPHWPLDAKTADIEKYQGVYDGGPKAIAEARVARMRRLGILEKDMPWEPPLAIDDLAELDSVVKHSPAYHAIRAQHKARPQDLNYRARVMTEVEFETDGKPRRATSFEENMMVFAAQIDSMDQNVGKVMAKLRELGLYENTLILFCSDNGASNESHWGTPYSTGNMWAQVSNAPFRRYKKSSFDGGVGTPLIIHWPERIAASAKGSINRSVGHLIDIMPTVLDAAGATYPKQDLQRCDVPASDGRSLLPALDGKHMPLAHPVFIEHDGNCALITEEWKLVADDGRGEGPWSLYNMKTDRCELTDVAAQHPEVVKNLDGQWRAIANRIGARRTGKSDPEWTKEKRNAWWKEYQAQMKRQK